MTIAKYISIARDMRGVSLRALEKQTGISNALLSQMETGHVKRPSFENVVKVSRALGIQIQKLAELIP